MQKYKNTKIIIMTQKQIAKYLLEIKAVKLQPTKPFTWASGWRSPIYCDNRKTLSYPHIRNYITNSFVELINIQFPEVEIIAGVATGAIAQGALIANAMNLPFIYVRSSSKGHGLQNKIEGVAKKNSKIVVIEDLISTGGSSIDAVLALRNAEYNVLGLCAIFTYNFEFSKNLFTKNNCKYFTLSDYNILIEQALNLKYIKKNDIILLNKWREEPEKF